MPRELCKINESPETCQRDECPRELRRFHFFHRKSEVPFLESNYFGFNRIALEAVKKRNENCSEGKKN